MQDPEFGPRLARPDIRAVLNSVPEIARALQSYEARPASYRHHIRVSLCAARPLQRRRLRTGPLYRCA